jgi:anti-anti-sigma factor
MTTERDGLAVVAVLGELNSSTAPRLSQALADLAEPGRVVLVDLSATESVDYDGLAPLVSACEHQRQLGGDLVLDAPTNAASKLIKRIELDKVLTVASGPESMFHSEPR